jgi:hypothetical protein
MTNKENEGEPETGTVDSVVQMRFQNFTWDHGRNDHSSFVWNMMKYKTIIHPVLKYNFELNTT